MILVLNSGSSTVKFRLVDPADPAAGRGGVVECMGYPGVVADHTAAGGALPDSCQDWLASVAAAGRAAPLLGRPPAELNLVVLHLGNGASACAVRGRRSVETSMGFTPLEGLVMGTRCGDLDAAVPGFLLRAGLPEPEVDDLLQHR